MYWAILFAAGLFEVAWAVGLKFSQGFTRLWPSVFTLVCMAISVFLLSVTLRHLPVGSAYAVWTGIGAVGTALVGMLFLHEAASPARLTCIALIVAGIVGLKLFTKA